MNRKITIDGKSFMVGSLGEPYKDFYDAHLKPEGVEELETFLAVTKNCNTMIDVGASFGVFSFLFSDERKISYAVDASPVSYYSLLQNTFLNKDKRVYPIHMLVGESTALVPYFQDSVYALIGAYNNTATCPSITLDAFCDGFQIFPDIIKIDIEGYEIKMLFAGKEVLRKLRPILFLEIHNQFIINQKNSPEQLLELKREMKYDVYNMRRKKLSDVEFLKAMKDLSISSYRTYWIPSSNLC